MFVLGASLQAAAAQDFLIGAVPVRSHSGQFLVHVERGPARGAWPGSNVTTNRGLLRLDAALVTVSCERIKQILARELGATAAWRGKIYVEVRPAREPGQNITITSEKFNDGWQYQVELPDPVERTRYVRAVVQVLLLELANRDSKGRLAEVPFWLAEGLAQQILDSNEIEIILAPPRESVNGINVTTIRGVTERKDNPLDVARAKLAGRPPLSFDELSWPGQDWAAAGPSEVYSASAQLFVGELLLLPDGRACLRTMLTQLPQFFNWQFAFLRAYSSWFQRPLDVEKWWALSVASASGRETAQMWPAEESWRKLEETLPTFFEVHSGTNTPTRVAWTLQSIIREWPLDRQASALTSKRLELETLRAHAAQEVVALVQEYCQALATYVQNKHKSAPISRIGKPSGLSPAAQEAIERLDILDARRKSLRPQAAPVADATK